MDHGLDPDKVFNKFRTYAEFHDAIQPCLQVNWDPTKTVLTHVFLRIPPGLARPTHPAAALQSPSPSSSALNTPVSPKVPAVMTSVDALPTPPRGMPVDDRPEKAHRQVPPQREPPATKPVSPPEVHPRLDRHCNPNCPTSPPPPATISPNIENLAPAVRERLEAALLGFYVRLMNNSPKAAQLKRQAADVSHLLEQIGDDDDAPESDMELRAQLHRELLIKREKYFTLLTKGEDLEAIRGRLSNGGGSRRGSFLTAGDAAGTDPRRTSNFLRRSSVTPMRNPVNWSKVQSRTNTGRRDSGGGGPRVNEYRRQTINDSDVQRHQFSQRGEAPATAESSSKTGLAAPRAAVKERRNSFAAPVVSEAAPTTRSKVRISRPATDSNPDRFKSASIRNRETAETKACGASSRALAQNCCTPTSQPDQEPSFTTPSISARQRGYRTSSMSRAFQRQQ